MFMFIEYIYFYCLRAGARLRKESTTASQQPLSSSLREQVSIHGVNAAGRDQSSVIRYDYQIYPFVSPGHDLKYIMKYYWKI